MIAHINGRVRLIESQSFWQRAMKLMLPISSALRCLASSAEDHYLRKRGALGLTGWVGKMQALPEGQAVVVTMQGPSDDIVIQINEASDPENCAKEKNCNVGSAHFFQGPFSIQKLEIAADGKPKAIAQLHGKSNEIILQQASEAEFNRCDKLLQDLPAEDALGDPLWARKSD